MFDRFLREEITGPLGMKDTFVGLPASEEGRVCRVHEMPGAVNRTVASPDPVLQGDTLIVLGNTPKVHQSVQPAAFGIASARDMARFYAMYTGLGQVGGMRIMHPETVGGAIAKQLEGTTPQGMLQKRALGHVLEAATYGVNPNPRSFGHGGAGTTVGWGDPDANLAVCYLTNGFQENMANQKRLQAVSQAVREAFA
jgi:CubicO group peptidase (beta-lactamase class C family)